MNPIKEISLHPERAEVWSSGAENLAVHLTYDLTPFLTVWPDATPSVAFERADGQKYAHIWALQGNILHIPLLQADTAVPGACKCMISVHAGDGQANTAVFCGRVMPGVDSLDEPPADPQQGVIEQVTAAAVQAQQALNNLQSRYYVPSVSGDMLTWQPTAADMPAVPATPITGSGGGAGILFIHITESEDGIFSADTPYAAIESALQSGQMVYATLENVYYLPLIGIMEGVALFSMVASFFGELSIATAIIMPDGSVTVELS